MDEKFFHFQKQISYSNEDFENEIEEENYFEILKTMLSELNLVIIQSLDTTQEDCQDRDEFIENMFRNFFLRQNYLKILLEKTIVLVEKQEEKWNILLQEKENLKGDLQSSNKMKNDYYEISKKSSAKCSEYLEELKKQSDDYNRALMEISGFKEQIINFNEIINENEQLKTCEHPIAEKNEFLREENNHLRHKLEESQSKIHKFKSELSELETKYLEVDTQREQHLLECKQLRILYKCKDSENNELKEMVNYLEEKAKTLKADFDLKINQIKQEKARESNESQYIMKLKSDKNINNSNLFGNGDKKTLKKSPSLFEQLEPPLKSAQSINNPKKTMNKRINFASFAFSNDDEGNEEIKIPNIFDYFQKPLPQINQINMKKEKTTEKWDPYHDYFVLTCISAKLNSPLCDDIIDVKTDSFYDELKKLKVPFHKWLDFINEKLICNYNQRKKEEKESQTNGGPTTKKHFFKKIFFS